MRSVLTVSALCATLFAAPPAKTKVPTLGVIPPEAELVCEATWANEKSDDGFPSNELYVADANGDHRTRITHSRQLFNHFAVSPDRKRIAAGRYMHGDTNKNGRIEDGDRKTLWLIDLEHQEEWPLIAELEAGFGGIDWTPDGEWIITSVKVNGLLDIHRIRPDGSGFENLTRGLNKLLGETRPKFVSDVSVSFDGKWIVFLYANDRTKPSRLVRMRLDGSEAHFVTDGGGEGARHAGGVWGAGDFDPEFSPDGRSVVFQRATSAHLSAWNVSSHDIMVSNLDGTGLRTLSPKGNQAVHGIADWSRDNRIVFSEWDESDRWTGSVLVNADGSGYHRIRKLAGCTRVRWIP